MMMTSLCKKQGQIGMFSTTLMAAPHLKSIRSEKKKLNLKTTKNGPMSYLRSSRLCVNRCTLSLQPTKNHGPLKVSPAKQAKI